MRNQGLLYKKGQMHAIFQKKVKMSENLAKMYKTWKYFENGQPRACDYRMCEQLEYALAIDVKMIIRMSESISKTLQKLY